MTEHNNHFIKNIYYMLAYAFNDLKQKEYEDVEKEEFDNVHNLFAAILKNGIKKQRMQGLYHEYTDIKEDIAAIRGKIDITGTIKNRIARRRLISCEYDEFSENNLLNQIIKTTVMLLLRHGNVDDKHKNMLKTEMRFFSNVDTIEDPKSIRWQAIRYQRNFNTYRMLIGICRLTIDSMLITTQDGKYRLASFIDNKAMHKLYQDFILAYYQQEFPKIKTKAKKITWALDDKDETDTEFLPEMQSDVMLKKGNNVLIIEAKYYANIMMTQYNIPKLRSAHLYQIFAYVKNTESAFSGKPHKVSGLLLYAGTNKKQNAQSDDDKEIQPNETYNMGGNEIKVQTLDLNKEFKEIAGQLNAIANDFFKIK